MKKLIFVFIISFTFSVLANALAQEQMTPAEAMVKGQMDARLDAQGKPEWVLAGFACGIFAIAWAFLDDPEPPALKLLGKQPEYITSYTSAYADKQKHKNAAYSVLGCLGAFMFLTVLNLSPSN